MQASHGFVIRRTLASILGRTVRKLTLGEAACIFSSHPSHTTDVFPFQSKGVLNMREGLIPAVLGTVVTASAASLLGSKYKLAATGVLGFGLAHIVLGAIDLIEHR